MKNRLFVTGILAFVLAWGMTVVGCDNGTTGENGLDPKERIEIKNVQVYNEDGTPFSGNEIIDFATGQGLDNPRIYLEGKIENGLLSVTIPIPQASALVDIPNVDGVKGYAFVYLITKSEKVLLNGGINNNGNGVGYVSYFIYVDKACTIDDVSVQTGWNHMTFSNEEHRWIILEPNN